MTPAVQYVRASTGLQCCSIEEQEAAIGAYARLRGYEIIETYSDSARSGLTLNGRAALKRLLADALAPSRAFRAILVYDVSRWGRFQDTDESAHYEFICRQAGVAVHYCAEPFDNDGSPEANLLKQVKRAVAAEDSRAQSARVRFARRYVVSQGFMISPPPFGLQRLIVDRRRRPITVLRRGELKATSAYRTVFTPGPPEAVATVQAIFRLYAVTGLRLPALARHLNATGTQSPGGGRWTGRAVKSVLQREAYAGAYIVGRRRFHLGKLQTAAGEPPQRIEGVIPALVSRELFDRANRLLDARRHRTDADLLDGLRRLLADRGWLAERLINSAPGLAAADTYRRRFGSLPAAYDLVGYRPGNL